MKFSIGIPAYKLSFLDQCIDSILNQTYQDFELIIVNDASPEDIDSLVGRYKDVRIQYYKNERNAGPEHVVDNWNRCLTYSSGDFFILMGDDDKMAFDYLKEFSKLITNQPNSDIYHCRSIIIDESSEPIGLTSSCPEFESVYDNIWHRMNNCREHFISDFVFRMATLKKNNGFYKTELAWSADDISSYMAIGNKGIIHTNKPLLYYRQSGISITSSASIELKIKAILKTKTWLINFLKYNEPTSPIDVLLKKAINNELNSYIKKTIISLLAYNSLYNKSRLKYYFSLWVKRNTYQLSTKEILYTYILAMKKRFADKAKEHNTLD